MKINIITHYYPPEIGAPQARLSEMAKTWKNLGHDVTVFTTFPNHPTGIIPDEYEKRVFDTEIIDGITIHRHWSFVTPNKGFLKKIINHISFMFSVVFLSLFRGEKPDIILSSSPTLFSVISAWIISKTRRTPFIFEVRDLWPGIFVELGILKNPLIIGILEKLELFLYKQASLVIPVTHSFKENIVSREIDSAKVHVITNGVNLNFFDKNMDHQPKLRRDLGISNDSFVALYIGAHGISHALDSIIETAKLVQSEITFLFVGEGAVKEKIQEMAKSYNLKNVIFQPSVPREMVPYYYALSNVCLVPLRNISGFTSFIPSKIFEIMACSRPIIGSVRGEAEKILIKSNAALVTPPEDQQELKKALINLKITPGLCEDLSKEARNFVSKNYDREQLAKDYIAHMEKALLK